MSKKRLQEEECQYGRQNGKEGDNHHDHTHPGPVGLEQPESNQKDGVEVHYTHQPGIELGLDGPNEEGLGPARKGHQYNESGQAVGQQYEEYKLDPLGKIV